MKKMSLQLDNGGGDDDDIRWQLLYGCGVNEDVDAINAIDIRIATMHLLLLVIEGRTIIILLLCGV
jgi:hypothetical protein